MRATLYVRKLVEQGSTSVADQLKACRALAERIGAHVVGEACEEHRND